MTKLIYWFSMGTILTAIAIMLYASYLLFYPFKPFILNRQPSEVLTKKVIAGQDLIYKVDYCRNSSGSGKVTRTIVGETFIPTPLVETVTKEGCGVNTIHLPIPEGATPGIYHLEVSAEFEPNALRKITTRFRSEDFEIVPKGDSTTIINNTNNTTTTTNTTTTETPDVIINPPVNTLRSNTSPPVKVPKPCLPLTKICL